MSEGRSQGPVAARSFLGYHSCYNPWSELQLLGVSTVRRLALLLSVHCPLFAWTASIGGLKGRGFRGVTSEVQRRCSSDCDIRFSWSRSTSNSEVATI